MDKVKSLALFAAFLFLLIPSAVQADHTCPPHCFEATCGLINVTIFEQDFAGDDETPVNRTIRYSTNIPLVYNYSTSDGTSNVTYTVTYDEGGFTVTDDYVAAQNLHPEPDTSAFEERFNVPADNNYTVDLTVTNSSLDVCQQRIRFTVQQAENESVSKVLPLIPAIFILLALVTLFGGGALLKRWSNL